jgi:hypothetical protein
MPPRRRTDEEAGPSGRGSGGGGVGAAVAVHPVHRFGFTQHLMKRGAMTEAEAKEAFMRLTGSDSGARAAPPPPPPGAALARHSGHAGLHPRPPHPSARLTAPPPTPPRARTPSWRMQMTCTAAWWLTRTGSCRASTFKSARSSTPSTACSTWASSTRCAALGRRVELGRAAGGCILRAKALKQPIDGACSKWVALSTRRARRPRRGLGWLHPSCSCALGRFSNPLAACATRDRARALRPPGLHAAARRRAGQVRHALLYSGAGVLPRRGARGAAPSIAPPPAGLRLGPGRAALRPRR